MTRHRRAAWLGALLVAGGVLAAAAAPATTALPRVATPVYLGFVGEGRGTLTQTKPGVGTPAVAQVQVQWFLSWRLRPGGGAQTVQAVRPEIFGIGSQRGASVKTCAGAVSANDIPLLMKSRGPSAVQQAGLPMPITIGLTTVTCYSPAGTLWFAPGVGKNAKQQRYIDGVLNYAVGPLRRLYAPKVPDAQAFPRRGTWFSTRSNAKTGNVMRLSLRWNGTYLSGYGGTAKTAPASALPLRIVLDRVEASLRNPASKLRRSGSQAVPLPRTLGRGALVVTADAGRARLAQGAAAIGKRRPATISMLRTASGEGVLARPLSRPVTVKLSARLLVGNTTVRATRSLRLAR